MEIITDLRASNTYSHTKTKTKTKNKDTYRSIHAKRERERGRVDLGGEGGNHSTDIEEDRERCVKG